MGNGKPWTQERPAAEPADNYRRLGLWRDSTPAADLRRWAEETPDAIAATAYTAGSRFVRMAYREYADQVDRATAILDDLGVGPGQVLEAVFDLLAGYGGTTFVRAPFFLEGITEAVKRRRRKLPSLKQVVTGATVAPAGLPVDVGRALGVVVQATWGMTEVGLVTLTSANADPPEWAARSTGTPHKGLEIEHGPRR